MGNDMTKESASIIKQLQQLPFVWFIFKYNITNIINLLK